MRRIISPLLFLSAGLLVYWAFRPEIYLFQLLQFDNPISLSSDGNPLFIFLANHSADLLWCVALLQIARLLRDHDIPHFYVVALLSLPFASELLQAAPLVPGTFDWIDLAIYLAVYSIHFHREIIEMNNTIKHVLGVIALTTFVGGIVGSTDTAPRKESTPKPVKPIEYTTGTFTLTAKENEYFTKKSLGRILKASKTPSIVLRVPVTGRNVTGQVKQKNNELYTIIEKEFAKAGYAVRDRNLFEQILENEQKTYSEIGKSTNTDLILELLSFNELPYRVRQYRDEAGELKNADKDITFTGSRIEF